MSQTELKLRVMFATCALLTLLAALVQLGLQGDGPDWLLMAAMGASLSVSAAEALGLCRLARQAHWRILGAVLLGIAAMVMLECPLPSTGPISMQA